MDNEKRGRVGPLFFACSGHVEVVGNIVGVRESEKC